MIRVLGAVAKNHMNEDMGRDLVIHILTDGHPTDDRGYENMSELYNWIISRQYKNKTFISVALCCDDRDAEGLESPSPLAGWLLFEEVAAGLFFFFPFPDESLVWSE